MAESVYITRARRRLQEINTEISLLEKRLNMSHQLGDSSSAQGITQTFNDNLQWQKRLDSLRRERDRLESALAGVEAPIRDGRVDVHFTNR